MVFAGGTLRGEENQQPACGRRGTQGGLLPGKAGSLLILRVCRDDKEWWGQVGTPLWVFCSCSVCP